MRRFSFGPVGLGIGPFGLGVGPHRLGVGAVRLGSRPLLGPEGEDAGADRDQRDDAEDDGRDPRPLLDALRRVALGLGLAELGRLERLALLLGVPSPLGIGAIGGLDERGLRPRRSASDASFSQFLARSSRMPAISPLSRSPSGSPCQSASARSSRFRPIRNSRSSSSQPASSGHTRNSASCATSTSRVPSCSRMTRSRALGPASAERSRRLSSGTSSHRAAWRTKPPSSLMRTSARHEGLAKRGKLRGRRLRSRAIVVGGGVADQRLERRQAGRGVAEAFVFEEPETSVGAELVVDPAEREGDQRQRIRGPGVGRDPGDEPVLDVEAGDPRRAAR